MNGKTILALFATAGVAAYILRDKIGKGILDLQEKVQAWVEDQTKDDEPDHETFPAGSAEGFRVGHDPR